MKAGLDRLDKAALAAMASLVVLIGLLLWRGDQAGVLVTPAVPVAGAESVASRPRITFTFSEPMNPGSLEGRLELKPAVTGTLTWSGTSATFTPARALEYDTIYTVTIRAGASGLSGRQVLGDVQWSFRTGRPRVVYLSPALEAGDLYEVDIDLRRPPRRVTSELFGVFDFAISPDGTRIVYSANREESGQRDLWIVRVDGSNREQLLACDQQVCQSPSWSADGTQVAFERRALIDSAVGRSPGAAHIWLIDVDTRSAAPLHADSQKLGTLPRWSPSGEKLAYYDPLASAITVVEMDTGNQLQLPSVLGDTGTWSPDGTQLVYVDLEAFEAGQYSHMLRADLAAGSIVPVTPPTATNDASPIWSPSGAWIAFGRQLMVRPRAGAAVAFGPQVWISAPDGTGARPVTNRPEYSYGGLRWSSDDAWIVAVRNHLRVPHPKPEVWLIRSDGGEERRLAEDATLPAWIP